MAGRISGLNPAIAYLNPDMPPEVAKLLAERGYAPDGTRLADMAAGIGTGFNRYMNPIRRAVGAPTSELPEGTQEVDYSQLLAALDGTMAGFGGADPYRHGRKPPPEPEGKITDRLIPNRGHDDMAGPGPSMALQRQMAGDMPPPPRPFGLDTTMRRMGQEREIDEDTERTNALVDALLNAEPSAMAAPQPAPEPPMAREAPVAPSGANPPIPTARPPERDVYTAYQGNDRFTLPTDIKGKTYPRETLVDAFERGIVAPVSKYSAPPIPKPKPSRPSASSYVVKKGDNPTRIAKAMGMTLKELEAKNPGIIKNARRLKIGSTVKL